MNIPLEFGRDATGHGTASKQRILSGCILHIVMSVVTADDITDGQPDTRAAPFHQQSQQCQLPETLTRTEIRLKQDSNGQDNF